MYSAPAGWNALYMSLFSVGPFGLQCLFKALCFLVICLLIYYWKWSTEIYYYCVAAYFSIHTCQCLLRMFGRSDAGCIYIYPCYTFLVKWPFYYYIMSLSPVTVFDGLHTSMAIPALFWLPFAWNIFLPSFHFLPVCILKAKVNLFVDKDLICFLKSIQPLCVFWLGSLIHLHLKYYW